MVVGKIMSETTRSCYQCQQDKPVSEFWEGRRQCKGCCTKYAQMWRSRNREHVRTYERLYRLRTNDRRRELDRLRYHRAGKREKMQRWRLENSKHCRFYLFKRRLRKYGLNFREWWSLVRGTNGRCEICRRKVRPLTDLYIDHDHADGVRRGLLCMGCNFGLGHFQDSPERLSAAISYLRRAEYSKLKFSLVA